MRISLALLFSITSILQIFSFPGQFENMRKTDGISQIFELTLTLLFALWFLCGQLAAISLWKVVGFIERGEFFTTTALKWIDRVVSSCWAAVAVPIAIFLVTIPRADDPGVFVLLMAVGIFLFSLALFATILREEIRSKT